MELLDCDDKIGTPFSADICYSYCTNHVFTPHQLWQCVTLEQPCMNKGKEWIEMLPGCEYQILTWVCQKVVGDMNIKHRYGINNNCLICTIDAV